MPKQSTLDQYKASYDRLVRNAGSSNLPTILSHIQSSPSKPSTKRMALNSVIGLARAGLLPPTGGTDISQFEELRDSLGVQLAETRDGDNITDGQKAALASVSLKDLQDGVQRLNLLKTKSLRDLEDYIALAILVKYPLRNDLIDLQIHRGSNQTCPDPGNWIQWTKAKTGGLNIYLREYKTAEANGPITIHISDRGINEAVRMLPDDRKYLLQTASGTPLSTSDFTHRLNRLGERLFGQRISTTTIRKIYLTDKYAATLGGMREDSRVMMHSLAMQQSTYISNSTLKK